ncbi:MAG: hypothetical protein R3211_10430 [Balneolaceae bacterium]|nr:hypothetical protein [Balneolaceae bacterium]
MNKIALLLSILTLMANGILVAQSGSESCREMDIYKALDFWEGRWIVYQGERQVGTNRIQKVLEGCAIIEHWRDARGGEGKSLFYVDPMKKIWKQVWVTPNPFRPGGTKEKQQVARYPDGGIRFIGEYMRNGRMVLDRTTLKPISADSVRQHIQISTDGGNSWSEGFDAIYVREKTGRSIKDG